MRAAERDDDDGEQRDEQRELGPAQRREAAQHAEPDREGHGWSLEEVQRDEQRADHGDGR